MLSPLLALLIAGQAPSEPAQPAAAPTTPAPAPTAGALVEPKPKILVLDFRDDGVGANAVRVIHDTLVSHVSKDTRLDVISTEDVRQAVEREAERRAVSNCNEEGCLAEIADALGAQLTLYGTAGKLGDLVIVNVSLYDARTARSVGRETIEVGSLEGLPAPLRRAGDNLIAQLGLAETSPEFSPGPLFWTGTAIAAVGLATGSVGAIVFAANVDSYKRDDLNPSFDDKTGAKTAQDLGLYFAIGGGAGLVVGGVLLGVGAAIE